MEMTPPPRLESIVRWLLPPDVREHVLGDLREQLALSGSTAPARTYVTNAVAVLPYVVCGQIQRTIGLETVTMQALVVFIAFVATVAVPRDIVRGDFATGGGLNEAFIAPVIELAGILLTDVYRRSDRWTRFSHVLSITVGAIAVIAVHFGLRRVAPSLAMAPVAFWFAASTATASMLAFRESRPFGRARLIEARAALAQSNRRLSRGTAPSVRLITSVAFPVVLLIVVAAARLQFVTASLLERAGWIVVAMATTFILWRGWSARQRAIGLRPPRQSGRAPADRLRPSSWSRVLPIALAPALAGLGVAADRPDMASSILVVIAGYIMLTSVAVFTAPQCVSDCDLSPIFPEPHER